MDSASGHRPEDASAIEAFASDAIARINESRRRLGEPRMIASCPPGDVLAGIPARHCVQQDRRGEAWLGALDRLRSILVGEGALVALIGDRGRGKTQIAAELAKRIKRARYIRALDIFIDLQDAMRLNLPQREILTKLVTPETLIIDELHERGETEWENRLLTYVIDRRYGAMRDTLLIGNMREDELCARLGASVYDRMVETGGVLVADWPSFRASE